VIGGKILDASALAALVRGRVSAAAWFATARTLSLPLYLPMLALAEVRAVRPDAGAQLAEVMGHPSVVLGELDAMGAGQVDQLLIAADVFDGCAGHIVHVARSRGWPVLTADPGRVASRRLRA
jgi:predicted nucleic acid-binding protein